jgi:hypothetical protein
VGSGLVGVGSGSGVVGVGSGAVSLGVPASPVPLEPPVTPEPPVPPEPTPGAGSGVDAAPPAEAAPSGVVSSPRASTSGAPLSAGLEGSPPLGAGAAGGVGTAGSVPRGSRSGGASSGASASGVLPARGGGSSSAWTPGESPHAASTSAAATPIMLSRRRGRRATDESCSGLTMLHDETERRAPIGAQRAKSREAAPSKGLPTIHTEHAMYDPLRQAQSRWGRVRCFSRACTETDMQRRSWPTASAGLLQRLWNCRDTRERSAPIGRARERLLAQPVTRSSRSRGRMTLSETALRI